MRTNPRRQFLRHTVRVPLELEAVASAPRVERATNISFGGLAFESGECREIGEILRLRIPTVQPPFEAQARVAWCRPEGEAFLIGVEFLDSSDAFQSRMVQQVCSIENYRRDMEDSGRPMTTDEAATEWISRYAGQFPDSEVISEPDHPVDIDKVRRAG